MTGKITYHKQLNDSGDWVEVAEYYVNGAEVSKAEFDRLLPDGECGTGAAHQPACWPMESQALAVHPKQVEAANERAKRHGIDVRYEKNGTAVIGSRHARKRLLRLEGFHDKAGGYGD